LALWRHAALCVDGGFVLQIVDLEPPDGSRLLIGSTNRLQSIQQKDPAAIEN
jgi:hypothetical protein